MSERTTKTKELILGFDAGCGKCSEIARRVEDRVGDRLSVRSLHDPDLAHWREEALGEDAPWAPTLFEVENGIAQVWTGRRMALPLSRKLGLSKTWQLMQALGDMPNAETLDYAGAATAGGMSRGRFLKGVGGATLAMGLMSGTDMLTLPAIAADRKRKPFDIVRAVPLKGATASEYIQRARLNADARFVAGGALNNVTAEPAVVKWHYRNGTIMTSVIFELAKGRQYLGVGVSTKPMGKTTSFSNLWLGDGTRLHDKKRPGFGRKILYKASASQRPVALAKAAARESLADDPLFKTGLVSSKASGLCPPLTSAQKASGCYGTVTRCIKKGVGCQIGSGVLLGGCWAIVVGGAVALPLTAGVTGALVGLGAGCLGGQLHAIQPNSCCAKEVECEVPC